MQNTNAPTAENHAARRRPWSATSTLLALALLPAVFGLADAKESPAQVVIMTDTMKFVPERATVHVGDTVHWESESVMVHTVTAVPSLAASPEDVALPPGVKPFDSGGIAPGKMYEHRFDVAGTYRYFCIPHEAVGMVGTVIVEE